MKDRFRFRVPFFDNDDKFIGYEYYDMTNGISPYNAGTCYMKDIQLCTGLKDKNGKLIYEGDIVKITHTTPYGDKIEQVCTVEFSDGCFWARDKTITVILYHEDNEYEVIGNIYANKELLEEK